MVHHQKSGMTFEKNVIVDWSGRRRLQRDEWDR